MKKLFKSFASIIVIVLIFTLGAYSLYKSSLFALKNIHFEYAFTNSYIETLRPAIEGKINSYSNQSLWNVDIFKIEKEIQLESWIKNVSVSRVFPDSLVIKIEPKQVIANVLKSPSRIVPVAADDTLLDAVEITKSPSAPLLSHVAFLHDDDLRKRALEFLKELPEDGSFGRQNISEILPYKNDSFKILLKNSNAEVLINNENVALKAARVSRVMDYLSEKEMEDRIIDANFSKKVLVRPRNHR